MLILNEQQLIALVKPDLPIKASPEREVLPILREKLPGEEITLATVFEIHSFVNMADQGGVACEIVPVGMDRKKMKVALVCSITHLRIKKGEPHYAEIVKYQVKRVKKLARQNPFF
ncbi:MAG: hypothetical protein AAB316_13910 [Bacteroidota bacterium]